MMALRGLLLLAAAARPQAWPDLSRPAPAIGGGERDAAVVVGIEGYGFVPPVPGAEANAKAWRSYLTRTRGAAAANVTLLLGADAAREDMLEAARSAADKVGPSGRLWFIFVGHGAPSADGKDGLLVGVDAQQKAESLQKRGLGRGELLTVLSKSRARGITVVLDACFSGRGPDGAAIAPGLQPLVPVAAAAVDPRTVVLTAAKGDQFAGALPGADRPAFSYLVLGALRGWAGKGPLTADSIWRYATGALEATLRGRNQTPDLIGAGEAALGPSAGEPGPDLAALAEATAGGGKPAPTPRGRSEGLPKPLDSAGPDLASLDVDALERYDAVARIDTGTAGPREKADAWRSLGGPVPELAAFASRRAAEWDAVARRQRDAEEAKGRRMETRNSDWSRLSRILSLNVVPIEEKKKFAERFVASYLDAPGMEPGMARALLDYAPPAARERLRGLAEGAAAPRAPAAASADGPRGEAGIDWVSIPGGSFMMGSDRFWNSRPVHRVTLKYFHLSKTEVTNGQYKKCVAAGVCSAPPYVGGDEAPAVMVTWEEARTFARWVGGRLPSEAEWEYAARGAGQERDYPWGDEPITCDRVATYGCRGADVGPGCRTPAGNTPQGLCDMAGNAVEWVQDWYHDTYQGAPADGGAREAPRSLFRAKRGGGPSIILQGTSKTDDSKHTAFRGMMRPWERSAGVGFRVAR